MYTLPYFSVLKVFRTEPRSDSAPYSRPRRTCAASEAGCPVPIRRLPHGFPAEARPKTGGDTSKRWSATSGRPPEAGRHALRFRDFPSQNPFREGISLRERTFQHFRRSRSSAGRMKTTAAEASDTESVAGSVRVCTAPSAFSSPSFPDVLRRFHRPEMRFTPAAMFCSRGESHFRALSQQPFSYRPIRLRVL